MCQFIEEDLALGEETEVDVIKGVAKVKESVFVGRDNILNVIVTNVEESGVRLDECGVHAEVEGVGVLDVFDDGGGDFVLSETLGITWRNGEEGGHNVRNEFVGLCEDVDGVIKTGGNVF